MSIHAEDWQEQVLAQLQAGTISLEEAEQRLLQGPGSVAAPLSAPPQAITESDIAIIGMACRFPDAEDWRILWANLKAGVDSVRDVPAGRWPAADGWYHPDPTHPDTAYTRRGGFLNEVDKFDAPFFKIAPAEAELMDPQQRIFLEEAYHAIEDAGLTPEELRGYKCGVFVGAADGGYGQILAEAERVKGRYVITGLDSSILAARIAYFLDLQGPTVALNTACSTSLLAIHEACESIRAGELELALAGGISLYLTPMLHIQTSQFQMLSPNGLCKTFDAGANGFVPGEGCGVVLLKQASKALADGDPIHAVIKGSGINQDGSTNGITAPSMRSQYRLEQGIYERFQIDPATIGYVEAHGTGTALGDPIEIDALTRAFAGFTKQKQFCAIGSIKTNIGHTLMAAGVAGVIKAVLCLKHGELPASLHFEQPNPHIDFAKTPFYVNTRHQAWPQPSDHPRRAAISSFGMSGTNAHLVLESAPVAAPHTQRTDRGTHLLTLATQNPDQLVAYAQRYQQFLADQPDVNLGDLCYTSHLGRNHFPHRLSFVADSVATLAQQLNKYLAGDEGVGVAQGSASSRPHKVAFLFTGQGAQYINMGRELYETSPTFRATFDRCEKLFQQETGQSLSAILYPEARGQRAEAKGQRGSGQSDGRTVDQSTAGSQQPLASLDDTTYTQPALFAVEYALATLWQSWGIHPDILIGHSVGELVAACVAGVFSLKDGIKLIAARGRLMGALPQDGAMVSLLANVSATSNNASFEETVRQALAPYVDAVDIAAVNGPTTVVISGQREAVQTVADELAATGVKTRQLTVSHAFHSPLMEPMLDAFAQVAQSITYHSSKIPIVSNTTGKLSTDPLSTAHLSDWQYWARHVREAVRFADGVSTLQQQGVSIFLEIGPQPVLTGMARQMYEKLSDTSTGVQNGSPTQPVMLPSLRPKQHDWQQMLTTLGELYVHGVAIDWRGVDRDYTRHRVAAPAYPFQRQRYWVEARSAHPPMRAALSPLLALIAEGKQTELQEHLLATGNLSPEAQAALPDVLGALIAQHQQQQKSQADSDFSADAALDAASTDDAQSPAQWRYEVTWGPHPLPAQTPATEALQGSWLILADPQGIGVSVAQQIEAHGGKAILIQPEVVAYDSPSAVAEFERLLEERLPAGEVLRGVIHLWSLHTATHDALDLATIEQTQLLGCRSLIALVQTLAKLQQRPRLWLVTQAAVAVQGTIPRIDQAPLWGLGGTVAQEYPDLHCVRLDVDSAEPAVNSELLFQELLATDKSTPMYAKRIAYRAGTRYAAQLTRYAPSPGTNKTLPVQAEGTYLITGGTGGLGLQVARWLCDAGARHLVLTSRRGATSAAAQETIQQLEHAGAQIQVVQGDVAVAADVQRMLQTITQELPPLRGIIHAAGTVEHTPLPAQTWDGFMQTMAPKVQGSWHLHQLTQELPLDFCVYFSSASSVLDTNSVGSYAAANAFLDAMAHYRRSLGLPALSINWGPWAEVGMAASAFSQSAPTGIAQTSSGMGAIEPTVGLQQLAALLIQDAIQVSVLPIDWSRYRYLLADAATSHFFGRLLQPVTRQGPQLQEMLAAAPLYDRFDIIVAYVQKQVAQVLGFTDTQTLASDAGLTDLGIDSLMAVELRNRLQLSLSCILPTTLIFDYPSVIAIAHYLTEGVLAPLMQEDEVALESRDHAQGKSAPNGTVASLSANGKNAHPLPAVAPDTVMPDDEEELSAAEIVARLAAKLGLDATDDE